MHGREYPSRISFVMPDQLYEGVKEAAASKMQSINSWLRQACLEQLSKAKETDADQRVQAPGVRDRLAR